jgi:hypothetical protein
MQNEKGFYKHDILAIAGMYETTFLANRSGARVRFIILYLNTTQSLNQIEYGQYEVQ